MWTGERLTAKSRHRLAVKASILRDNSTLRSLNHVTSVCHVLSEAEVAKLIDIRKVKRKKNQSHIRQQSVESLGERNILYKKKRLSGSNMLDKMLFVEQRVHHRSTQR